jgi:hypothetical protein
MCTLGIAALVLWVSAATLLYRVVAPFHSLNDGKTFVFDSVALGEAMTIIVCVSIASWIPVLMFTPRSPGLLLAFFTALSTWIFAGIPFLLIDKFDLFDVTRFRAAEVMEDGNDLAFSPLLIPLISVLSGVLFVAAMRVSMQSKWRDPA